MTDSADDHLRSTRNDVASLPGPLASEARVIDWGEAEWPRQHAEAAIRALVELGRVVNVLQYARYRDGELVEFQPISTYEGARGEANLTWILPGVPELPVGTSAVVCWYPD